MSAQRVSNLIGAARHFAASGEVVSARRMLEQALLLQPAHEEARALLARLVSAPPDGTSRPPGLVARLGGPASRQAGMLGAPTDIAVVVGAIAVTPMASSAQAERAPLAASIPGEGASPPSEEGASQRASAEQQVAPVAGDPVPLPAPRPGVAPNAPADPSVAPGVQVPAAELSPRTPAPQASQAAMDQGLAARPPGGEASNAMEAPLVVLATPAGEAEAAGAGEGAEDGRGILELLQGAQALLDLGDYVAALSLLVEVDALGPSAHAPRAATLRRIAEPMLLDELSRRIGSTTARPEVRMSPDALLALGLDHRAGFVLSQLDGALTYDELFEVSGMPRAQTALVLMGLLDVGAIA